MDIKSMTTTQLKAEATSLHSLCHGENQCFGTKDLVRLELVLRELGRRGVEPREELTF